MGGTFFSALPNLFCPPAEFDSVPGAAYISRGRKILFKISGGGHTFFETGGAYAPSAPRLRSPHASVNYYPSKRFLLAIF